MDSLIFQAMAVELNRKLACSRLDKVLQIGAGTLVCKLWTGREKLQLVLNAEDRPSFYLSREHFNAPAKPPRFCQLLRARLRRLQAVRAEPFDRVVHLLFTGQEQARYDLIFEAVGGRGNLILLDSDERIIDLLYRQDGRRKLLPGEPYVLPEQQPRARLFGESSQTAALLEAAMDGGDLSRANVYPMTPALGHMLSLARRNGQSFPAILSQINAVFATSTFRPLKICWDGKSGLLPFHLDQSVQPVQQYHDLSEMMAMEHKEAGRENLASLAETMANLLTKQRNRLIKRIDRICADQNRQSDPDKYRVMGDLLLTNLHNLQHYTDQVEVDDYSASPPAKVTIQLDPKRSPRENAERYFKLYRKAKRAAAHHHRRLAETRHELDWLDDVELALQEAVTPDELFQVQAELADAGLLKNIRGQLGKRQPIRIEDQLHHASTPGGWPLYWGKNSRTNDYVSRTLTAPSDFWLHAKEMPGAHLVLKCGDQSGLVNEEDIHYAASLAAGYSKGRHSGKVEVIVAKGSAVKKPKGARPGLVTVNSYRSVLVLPRRMDAD